MEEEELMMENRGFLKEIGGRRMKNGGFRILN